MAQGQSAAGISVLALAAALMAVSGCASSPGPTPSPSHPAPSPTPSVSAAPTQVTVIAPLGVNFRSAPSASASVVGVIPQGVSLPLVSAKPAAGGWWKVQGATQVGWITSDAQYTSTLTFETFEGSGTVPWSVMYPDGWNFDQESSGPVVFNGPTGSSITFDIAAALAQLPPAAPAGAATSGTASIEVYGVTAPLVRYASPTEYKASVEFQAEAGLAFLIQAQLPAKGGAATFNLFLNTVFITPTASPSP